MRLALVADVYPPLRSSGAVQLRDLSRELARQGHQVTMMVASPDLKRPWELETADAVQVLRLRTPRTKDTGFVRRTLGEFLMSFAMLYQLRRSPLARQTWDGVVWYSPTIFLGPIVRALKIRSRCKSYLIVRDIFPEWSMDMGLIGRGLPYYFFKANALFQYSVADVIGIQAEGNRAYFSSWATRSGARRVEVLQNWLAEAPDRGCSISVANTHLGGRKIFVYAGNMGIAQGVGILLDLADQVRGRADIGFLFVGRGRDAGRLRVEARKRGLSNVAFFDEIEPDQIPGLYGQCHVGLIALDPRHKTHNIPGKFLSYMQSGLPVLAAVNKGNDIVALIETERVGHVCTDACAQSLKKGVERLLDELSSGSDYARRCKALSAKLFMPEVAAMQIVEALQ